MLAQACNFFRSILLDSTSPLPIFGQADHTDYTDYRDNRSLMHARSVIRSSVGKCIAKNIAAMAMLHPGPNDFPSKRSFAHVMACLQVRGACSGHVTKRGGNEHFPVAFAHTTRRGAFVRHKC